MRRPESSKNSKEMGRIGHRGGLRPFLPVRQECLTSPALGLARGKTCFVPGGAEACHKSADGVISDLIRNPEKGSAGACPRLREMREIQYAVRSPNLIDVKSCCRVRRPESSKNSKEMGRIGHRGGLRPFLPVRQECLTSPDVDNSFDLVARPGDLTGEVKGRRSYS